MIALDIETTGLSEIKNAMVSLGAVHIESGNTFYGESRVYVDTQISSVALGINGFTEDEVKASKKELPHQLYKRFSEWCTEEIGSMPSQGGNELLIGQNLPSFDLKFIKHYHFEILGNNFKWPFGHRYLDLHTFVFAKTGKSLSHDEALIMLGLPEEEKPHNALNGAMVVKNIFELFNK